MDFNLGDFAKRLPIYAQNFEKLFTSGIRIAEFFNIRFKPRAIHITKCAPLYQPLCNSFSPFFAGINRGANHTKRKNLVLNIMFDDEFF